MPTHAVCRRCSATTGAAWSHCTVLFLITLFFNCVLKVHSSNEILLPSQQLEHNDSLLSSPATCPATNPNLYYQPIIGILSHPGDGASGRLSNATNISYIAASYVKLAETGGARVIPLIYNEPPEKLLKDNNILEEFRASNQAGTLQFVENATIEGSIFRSFPPDLLKKLSTDCIVMQNHHGCLPYNCLPNMFKAAWKVISSIQRLTGYIRLRLEDRIVHYGLSPGRLQDNQKLSSFFEILTTSTDRDDKVYVSTMRSWKYPVTGFQWHPEKNAFEWGSAKIPHTEDAIRVTHSAANFLVSEARKSTNRPIAQEVRDNLIYNYRPTFGGKAGKGYDEVYIFEYKGWSS